MSKPVVFAPDLGNSYTHFVNPQTFEVESLPSLVAPARKIRHTEDFGDLSGSGKDNEIKEMVLQTDEGTYFVGHYAYIQSRKSVKLSLDTQQSMFIKDKLLKTSMAMVLPQRCQVKLVLGHPYSESDLAEEYQKMALGKHEYVFNGKEYCQEVVDVVTMSQPVAAFLGIVTDPKGQLIRTYTSYFDVPIIVMDIGGGTVDFCWLEKNPVTKKLEVVDEYSASKWLGVWYALGLIKEELALRYGVEKRIVDLEYELKGDKSEVNINGQMVDITKLKNAMYAQTANDILTFGTNLWQEQKGKIGLALSAGGGSETFQKALIPKYNQLFKYYEFADMFVIAKGQWAKAVRLWGAPDTVVAGDANG